MSNHADPVALDRHLREMCSRVREGATDDEATEWLYCDAPHGQGIEPGYAGQYLYFPATLRTKRKERDREIVELRKRGWRYDAIACAVHLSESHVGETCREAGMGSKWYVNEWPHGRKGE